MPLDEKSAARQAAAIKQQMAGKPSKKITNTVGLGEPLPGRDPSCALSRPTGPAAMPRDFEWVRKNIPCQAACPAGTDIPGYLQAIGEGDYDRAYRINLEDNVFPAVLGRVCTRPCEPVCRHGWEGLGDPVAICFAKRSAEAFMEADTAAPLEPVFEPSGKSVAVVGAGPAGLAAARELARWGHQVTVFEKGREPGGLMMTGIPAFRLPRDVVRREVEQVKACGVEIQCGVSVGESVSWEALQESYDALVIAAGCSRPSIPEIEGIELEGVRHGLPFLQEVNGGRIPTIGKNVVVIGGGFTAVDCSRVALRLDAVDVRTYYRRSQEEMYITGHEIAAMREEGARFETMTIPVRFEGKHGKLKRVHFVRSSFAGREADGRRSVLPLKGTEFVVDADTVLLATGQEAALEHPEGDGIFRTGDFATGALSIIDAIGHAKKTAREVDVFLVGKERFRDVVMISDAASTGRTRDMDDIPRQPMNELQSYERGLNDEVEMGLDGVASRQEAKRCYLCSFKFEIDNDLCIYCDRCLKVRPVEGCIVKAKGVEYTEDGRIDAIVPSTGPRDYNLLLIDQEQCIRCNACVEVCPVECISLQEVKPATFVL